jgi:tetratricopeptide (TPR) repeat protein
MHVRYLCLSALVLAAFFPEVPAMADHATSVPLQMAQAGTEFDFWNSIKDSKKAEDYQAYLDRYPNGNFADLAKLRMKKYAAAAPAPKPAPAAVDPQQADITYWNAIKASKNVDDYRAYLKKYPNGEFVDVAKLRVEQLSAPAAAPVQPPAQPAPAEPKTAEPAAVQPAAPEPATTEQTPPQPAATQPAAPKPAPTPGMTFEAKNTTVYARDGGQVRAAPDPKAALVIKLKTNAEVQATGLSTDRRWWRVQVAGGQVGYMHHSVVGDRPETAAPLPATEPTAPLPTTTPPATPLPTTTPPATPLPTTPPASAPPPSIGPPAKPVTVAPSGKASSAAPDEGVCPATSLVAPDSRVAACERLVEKAGSEPKATVAALGDLAAALAQAGRYDEAVGQYKQAAALAPRDATIYYDIGLVRLDQLHFPEARAAFDRAAQLDPRNPDIVFRRGISYVGLGDFETAKLEVTNALLGKDDAAYYEKLGEIEIARGDLASAKVALDRGRKADAGRRSLILAVVNYYAGDNDTAAVQLAASSDDPTAALWNALIKKAKGDAAGADEALKAGHAVYGATWPGPIFATLSGTLDLALARASAQSQDETVESQRLCTLNLFAGEWAYLSGDKDAARLALQAALDTRVYYTLEFAAAKARLANMGG